MARSPWSRPSKVPAATAAELERARELAPEVRPSMQVGYKTGLRQNIIAGVNARLVGAQLVKVEFVKIKASELADLIAAIEAGTSSTCVHRHGNTATFFRRHPNRSFP
jgi:RNA-binding protein YhbY